MESETKRFGLKGEGVIKPAGAEYHTQKYRAPTLGDVFRKAGIPLKNRLKAGAEIIEKAKSNKGVDIGKINQ